jgi:fermentation-respiration switch protein FrsA (DUF1100 family)
MTATPSSSPSAAAPGARRGFLILLAALFTPVILIWFGAAALVARGLRFPPALPYSNKPPAAAIMPQPPSHQKLSELLGAPAHEIALRPAAGGRVRAWFVAAPGAQTAVVLAYPNQRDPRILMDYFRLLHAGGYAVVMLDYLSGSGGAPSGQGMGWEEYRDVADAVTAIRLRGIKAVAAMGVSEGAAAVLFAGSHGAPLAAIIADSSYASLSAMLKRIPPLDSLNPLFDNTVMWELGLMKGRAIRNIAPSRAAAKLGATPLMVINGGEDPLVASADARKIFAAAQGPKELWIVPEAGHAGALAIDPKQYASRVRAFLARYMPRIKG